jgi:hypothetical protein
MKKILWIATAALAMGCVMNTYAVSNATFGVWSFEQLSAGTVIPGANGTELATQPYGSWSAATNDENIAYVTNVDLSGVSTSLFPIATGTHTNALYFSGAVTNNFDTSLLSGRRYKTEFLLKAGQLEDLGLLSQVSTDARLAFYFDTGSNFVLMCNNGAGAWTNLTFTSVKYNSNEWVRISIEQDDGYLPNDADSGFSIALNGASISHEIAMTRVGDVFSPGNGTGTWFVAMNAPAGMFGMKALAGLGIGLIDDVVTTEYTAPASLIVFARSFNSAYGAISPAGSVTIVQGVPQTFTLTVNGGVAAFVSGLDVEGTQTKTNTDDLVVSQPWDVTYEQIQVLGTNVTALFTAKAGTSAKWITDNFEIGGTNLYQTFADAEADDYDGDGFNNKAESIVGTDPKDPQSYLKITNITVNAAGEIVVSFQGSAAGTTNPYQLYAADLVNGSYASAGSTNKGAGEISINVAPSSAKKFYKIRVPYAGE